MNTKNVCFFDFDVEQNEAERNVFFFIFFLKKRIDMIILISILINFSLYNHNNFVWEQTKKMALKNKVNRFLNLINHSQPVSTQLSIQYSKRSRTFFSLVFFFLVFLCNSNNNLWKSQLLKTSWNILVTRVYYIKIILI